MKERAPESSPSDTEGPGSPEVDILYRVVQPFTDEEVAAAEEAGEPFTLQDAIERAGAVGADEEALEKFLRLSPEEARQMLGRNLLLFFPNALDRGDVQCVYWADGIQKHGRSSKSIWNATRNDRVVLIERVPKDSKGFLKLLGRGALVGGVLGGITGHVITGDAAYGAAVGSGFGACLGSLRDMFKTEH